MIFNISPEHYKIAEENGINARTVYRRVHERGWDIELAITKPLQKKTSDKEYLRWSKIARNNGISSKLFWQRVNCDGWDYKKAATHHIMTSAEIGAEAKKKIKYTLTSPEILALAEANGIDYKCLWYRVRRLGWSLDEAANTPKISRKDSLKRARKKSSLINNLGQVLYNNLRYFNH